MARFPDIPMFAGINAPSRVELDLYDLETEGDVPSELDGAFYRVAPDRQFPPLFEDDVPFNSDGTVSMFRFDRGIVHLKHRYVQTERFKLERAAGRALFGKYRNPFTDDPSVAGKNRNLANTTPMVFDGGLFALREDSRPIAMDALSLETRGEWDFHGTLKHPTFTAHPKVDPRTGQMIAFGFGAKGLFSRDTVYYEISPDGRVTHEVSFEVPYYCMLHDFGVTRNFAVFPIVPIVGVGVEGLKVGKRHYAWDSTKSIYLGVLPRGGEASDLRWFRAPNQFCSHVMNAFDNGSTIYFDTPVAESNMFPFFPEGDRPYDPTKAASRLTRWCVEMRSKREGFESVERLSDFVGEFPCIDPRYQTEPYRHGWMLGFDQKRNSLAHIDHAGGRTQVWTADDNTQLQEPCFIPKGNDAAEGEGYVVQLATRIAELRTEVLLFDSLRVSQGPIATLKLPLRLRPGYHGVWATRDQIMT